MKLFRNISLVLIFTLLIIFVGALIAEDFQRIEISGERDRTFTFETDATDTTESIKLFDYDFEVNEIDVSTGVTGVDSMELAVRVDYLNAGVWVNYTSATISVETAAYNNISIPYDSIKGASHIRMRNVISTFDSSKTSGTPTYNQNVTLRNE